MGLLDNSGQTIIVDAVLTDIGRDFLSRNDGSFEIVRYSFGDDEIDYTLFNAQTGSLQQDSNILNTFIFEANVNETIGLRYQLLSISNPDLNYLPILQSNITSLTLGERTDSQVGQSVQFNQTTSNGVNVPSEVIDGSFLIQVNNDLLFVSNQTPVSITPYGTAQYILPRSSIGANQGAQVALQVAVQSLSNQIWSTYGIGSIGSRTITTKLLCKGALSGLATYLTVVINEQFSRSS